MIILIVGDLARAWLGQEMLCAKRLAQQGTDNVRTGLDTLWRHR